MDSHVVNRRPAIRIVIADDHPIFRDGLRRLLESEAGHDVVGLAHDGVEAVHLVRQHRPDVLLLDLAMPNVTGMQVLERLRDEDTRVATLVLTASVDAAEIAAALQLGARGVLRKEAATELLFTAIDSIIAGRYWVDREPVNDLRDTLRSMLARAHERRQQTFGLTRREFDILSAIVSGAPNKDIARQLAISEDTVKHHLTNIFNKTGASSRLELALFAVHHKLVDPP